MPPPAAAAVSVAANDQDADSDGWRDEDDNEEDIFSGLAQLLTSDDRPKLSVVQDSFQVARGRYEEERWAHVQKIEVLEVTLALTLTSNQKEALKRARQTKWKDAREFKVALQAELAREAA